MMTDSRDGRKVVLKTDMPFELPPPPFDDSIPIGSETLHGGRTKYIIVDGIDPHQADLFKTGEQDWRIRNCGRPGIVRINNEDVDSERIFKPGERLSLGDVILILSEDGRRLEIPHDGDGIRIQVDGLTRKTPRKTILDGVSFIAKPGEFVGILGPSGCGKSSLIQTIAGLVPISDGKILVNGVSVTNSSEELERFQKTCVYLPQNVDNSFHDDFTIREEMSIFRQLRTAEDCDGEAADLNNLKSLGFSDDIMDKPVRLISGGERRRVAIARALALRPKVMLFDEPTAGLDTVSEHDVMERLRNLAHIDGKTIFCVTHVLTRAMDFDRVLLMRPGGKLVFCDKPGAALAKVAGANDANAWERLYNTLKSDSEMGNEIWNGYKRLPLDESGRDKPLPEPGSKLPSLFQRILGYLKSFSLTFCHRIVVSLLPFVVPVILAFLLWMTCRDRYTFGEVLQTFKEDCYVFAFCGCLTMFWLGLLGSVGTLVRERIPRRCLERLDGVPVYAYLFSKVIWHVTMCLLQSVIFAGCLAFFVRNLPKLDEALLMGCALWGELISPLLVCSLSGMFIGMSVSAAFSSETRASEFVPIFAIAQLVLSRVVVNVEKTTTGAIVRFTDMMPCRWPIDWMSKLLWEDIGTIGKGLNECSSSWKALACWSIGCIALSAAVQWWQERKWQGR